ncbi:hypothetical protein [Malaciobacter mytili]|uniref:hypothetical protein n=1 Tax=Malaciobacter mytili TaxID=603050 RepID=UPI003A835FF0
MKEVIKLLRKLDLKSNIFYNKIIENKNSVMIKKSCEKKITALEIKELVSIYDLIYTYKDLKIKVAENGDILIKKI